MTDKIALLMLQHIGKDNAISAREISKEIGQKRLNIPYISRKVHECVHTHNLPIISCATGYYIARTEAEMNTYNDQILTRSMEMLTNLQAANKAFTNWHK